MGSDAKSDYFAKRKLIIRQENEIFMGGKLILNEDESKLNELIIQEKCNELEPSYNDCSKYLPKQHFFKSKTDIEKTEIFKFLKKLPKGHSLHTHLLASASADFVIKNITYKENIYGKFVDEIFKVKFMKPDEAKKDNWVSFEDMRKKDTNFDTWLRTQLTLITDDPEKSYGSIEIIWAKFKKLFSTVYDMLSYKQVFEEYYYQCLQEHYDDNVMYVEFRATPMPLYDLEGTVYKTEDFFQSMLDVEAKFKKDHNDFFGARYIHSLYRGISVKDLEKDLKEISDMKMKFPKLIIGLDLVGFEDEPHPLIHYYDELCKLDFNFYFHAGETNWFGHVDTNLIDAVLMKTKRIGHGFALLRHPILMEMVLQQNIAIELCPISNQVLLLNEDPRNHPLAVLMANGFPVVVSNDDPSTWGASGLSYDWYIAFMAMTPSNCGLRFLKQLALNSIKYSGLGDDEVKAMDLWTTKWNEFVSESLKNLRPQ